jgi:hypothetical protein
MGLRFEDVAKALASGQSRRGAIARLAGGLFGGAIATALAGQGTNASAQVTSVTAVRITAVTIHDAIVEDAILNGNRIVGGTIVGGVIAQTATSTRQLPFGIGDDNDNEDQTVVDGTIINGTHINGTHVESDNDNEDCQRVSSRPVNFDNRRLD